MDSDNQGTPQDQKQKVLRKLPPAGSRSAAIGGKSSSGGSAGLFRPRSIKDTAKKSYPRPVPQEEYTERDEDFGAKTASMAAEMPPVPRPAQGSRQAQGYSLRRPDGQDSGLLEHPPGPPPAPRGQSRPPQQRMARPQGPPRPQGQPPQQQPQQRQPQQRPQQQPQQQRPHHPQRAQSRPVDAGLRAAPRQEMKEEALRRKAQLYDWGKTEKFSADQKKFLERVFGQFSDYLTTKMAPLLQARVEVIYEGAKLRPYGVFLQGLYEPISIVLVRIDPQFKGLIVVDFPLSFAFIDRCLGGKGIPIEEVRYFTEIEVAILERVVFRLIESYQEAWSEVREIKPQYLEMQFNPQTVHIMKPSDTVVCVSFNIKIGSSQGPVYIVLPFEYLQTVLPKANFEEFMLTRSSSSQVTPSVAPLFAKNLEQARVPVSVELGSTELLFADLAVLEVGDFIKLDQEITKPLRIRVNERCKFQGRPGITDNKLSVQVTKVLQEGDEDFDV